MAVLINAKDCATTRVNLGFGDCVIKEGMPTGFIITPKGWSIDTATDTFDKDYVNDQIQQGNFVPVLGAVEFTNNTPESTKKEFASKIKSVVAKGLPEFTFKYVKGGWKWASALYSYDSQQAFDLLFTFDSGAIAGAVSGTTFSGFDLGMLDTGTYMFTDNNEPSSVSVSVQLMNAKQYNENVAILDASVLDFNVNTDIFPITDIVMTGRADVSESKVYFKAKFAMNQSSVLGGIAIANLRVTISGSVDTITSGSLTYNSTTQEYSFTPTASLTTSTPVVVQLYDTANTIAVAKIGQKYYEGATESITPVA